MEFLEQNWQSIAVALCIGLALWFLVVRTYSRVAGKSGKACGGCGSCGSATPTGATATKIAQLVQIDIKKKTLPS